MNLYIGKSTKKGQKIRLGDIVKSDSSAAAVVCINETDIDFGEYVCIMVDIKEENTIYGKDKTYKVREGFVYPISDMLQWSNLKVIGNIITLEG